MGAGSREADSLIAIMTQYTIARGPTVLTEPATEFVSSPFLALADHSVDVVDGKKGGFTYSTAITRTAVGGQCVSAQFASSRLLDIATRGTDEQPIRRGPTATTCTEPSLLPLNALVALSLNYIRPVLPIGFCRTLEARGAALLARLRLPRVANVAFRTVALNHVLSHYTAGVAI